MTTTCWNDEEDEQLQGMPLAAQLLYLRGMRRHMDYRDGLVGMKRRTSWQAIREVLYVEPHQGAGATGAPSKDQVRRLAMLLERAGLIEIRSDMKTKRLVFFLPLAFTDQSVLKNTATKPPLNRHTNTAIDAAIDTATRNISNGGAFTENTAIDTAIDTATKPPHLKIPDTARHPMSGNPVKEKNKRLHTSAACVQSVEGPDETLIDLFDVIHDDTDFAFQNGDGSKTVAKISGVAAPEIVCDAYGPDPFATPASAETLSSVQRRRVSAGESSRPMTMSLLPPMVVEARRVDGAPVAETVAPVEQPIAAAPSAKETAPLAEEMGNPETPQGKPVGRKKKSTTKSVPPTNGVWEAYASAYQRRYGEAPLRNQHVNGQLAHFVRRVPMDEAPLIAAFYVGHNGVRYVNGAHAVGLMLMDAEKLRMEWKTGRAVPDVAFGGQRRGPSGSYPPVSSAPPSPPASAVTKLSDVARAYQLANRGV